MCHFFWQVSMLFLRPCIQGFFSGFSIISFTKLVNVTWDNKKEFYRKSGTLSIPGDFHFWDSVNAAISSSTIMFSHSVLLLSHYLSPYSISSLQIYCKPFYLPISLSRTFVYCPWRCFFYNNLVFYYLSVKFLGISLENFILPVEFVTFIKSSFPLFFYLYFLL